MGDKYVEIFLARISLKEIVNNKEKENYNGKNHFNLENENVS